MGQGRSRYLDSDHDFVLAAVNLDCMRLEATLPFIALHVACAPSNVSRRLGVEFTNMLDGFARLLKIFRKCLEIFVWVRRRLDAFRCVRAKANQFFSALRAKTH